MGHREELLSAARKCLVERGYARTTARDLVAVSGTNLASIGYHFGSKDELLAEALEGVLSEYTEAVLGVAAAAGAEGDPGKVLTAGWTAMTGLLEERRPLLVAFVEALAQAERNESIRARLIAAYEESRQRIVQTVVGMKVSMSERDARAVASFLIAVSDGYTVQWLLDPAGTPSGPDLLAGARKALSF